jgi:hypothetical protein
MTRAAPTVGQHTREVLREAGIADGEVDALLVQRPGLEGWTVLVRGDLEAQQPVALSA